VLLLVGASTGRDGIQGASFASATLGEDREERRPAVQVGNPFLEKLLMEACLELARMDGLVAMQDLGAAGLTCALAELTARGSDRDHEREPVGSRRLESSLLVEPGGIRIDRVHENRSHSDVLGGAHDSLHGVTHEIGAQALSLLGLCDRQASDQANRDREMLRDSGSDRRRGVLVLDLAGHERVVAEHAMLVVSSDERARDVSPFRLTRVRT